jgi:hypothetical protein
VNNLQQVYRHCKDLSPCLQNLLVLLKDGLVLFFELNLLLALLGGGLEEFLYLGVSEGLAVTFGWRQCL